MTHRYFQTSLPVPLNRAGDATKLKEELDEDLVLCVVSFQLISSGAQLGSIGDLALGVVFFYFGSVVGP